MRIVTFKTPRPKRFSYKPRYYDEDKEALEQRKAALGYETKVSHRESLRLQMARKWQKGADVEEKGILSKSISYFFYGAVIVGGVYLIFFTDFVYKLIALFGLRVGQ
ncbi:MAG: hypothetical protein L3J31_03535 [Bacteroidales bacterium]|nr:hypothetical protein [Bacteroidales bacterium]MCF6341860.1 hypothetical protein [Bacteroidales bacterium]